MDHRTSALAQALLEGVDLPAAKEELVAYARRQGAGEEVLWALDRLPERKYRSLDEAGEALSPAQPPLHEEQAARPRAESGGPPGGAAYAP